MKAEAVKCPFKASCVNGFESEILCNPCVICQRVLPNGVINYAQFFDKDEYAIQKSKPSQVKANSEKELYKRCVLNAQGWKGHD